MLPTAQPNTRTDEKMKDAGAEDSTKNRKKVFRTRARTGCDTCRATHVRCDEGKPICNRCARLQRVCTYSSNGNKNSRRKPVEPARGRELRPLAPAMRAPIIPGRLHASLDPTSGLYFDFFQTVVVPQLTRQPDGPAGFWSRTLLRECSLDSCVVDAVVGIGALSRARYDGPHPKPHYKLQQFGPLSCVHYYTAVRHYTRALAEFRLRIEAVSHTPIPPRTLLIFTVLFSIFELLHGNTNAFDNLISNGLQMFSNQRYLPGAGQDQQNLWALTPTALDDAEIYDAECFLARTATWSAIFSPMYPRSRYAIASMASLYELGALPPDRHTTSVEEFWQMWWQFITMAVVWHLRVRMILAHNNNHLEGSVPAKLRQEQRLMLERTSVWADETQARLDAVTDDGFEKYILTMLVFEIKICYWSGYYALDLSETAWQSCTEECIRILDMAHATVAELTSTIGYETIVSDGLMIGLLQLARESRDWSVRSRALGLAKRLITPASSWHVKSFILGASACIEAEERGRDGETGKIPMSERYDWTDGSWNDDFTELHVTITSKGEDECGVYRRKNVVLHTDILGVF